MIGQITGFDTDRSAHRSPQSHACGRVNVRENHSVSEALKNQLKLGRKKTKKNLRLPP